MNIGMILNAPYPHDIRVKKEADALIAAGFRVHLLCLRKASEPYEEVVDGLKVTRIDAGTNNYQLARWDVVMSMTFKHPRFMDAIPRWVSNCSIQCLHVHDLPLAGTALALRGELGVKVIVDLHENYPEALRTWFEWRKGLLVRIKNRLFMNPGRWSRHERNAVKQADCVIAVVDEMKQRLLSNYQVEPAKIVVVSNTEEKSFANQPLDQNIYGELASRFKVVYSGGIGPHRGIDVAIEAMKYLGAHNNIDLVIIGSGSNDVIAHLKSLSEKHGVASRVHFMGYQPFNRFYSYMHLADVNLIPHKSNAHTDNTIPHKLFQSMMAGKPVVVSSSRPLKRIVSQAHAGLVFEAGNPRDLAQQILRLYKDTLLRKELGSNGVKATLNGTLNWETEQEKLVDLYRTILPKNGPR